MLLGITIPRARGGMTLELAAMATTTTMAVKGAAATVVMVATAAVVKGAARGRYFSDRLIAQMLIMEAIRVLRLLN